MEILEALDDAMALAVEATKTQGVEEDVVMTPKCPT